MEIQYLQQEKKFYLKQEQLYWIDQLKKNGSKTVPM